MKTKRSLRTISLALVLTMLMSIFAVTAFADIRETGRVYLKPNVSETIYFPNDSQFTGATMISATSSDTTVLQVMSVQANSVAVLTKNLGTSDLSIRYRKANSQIDVFLTVPVHVTSTGAAITTQNETGQSMTFSTLGSEQTSNYSYTNVTSLVSSNTTVASARFENGRIVVRALANGSATITAVATRDNVTYNVSIAVTVNTSSVATTGVVVNGSNITMPASSTHVLAPTYYSAQPSSGTPAVATVTVTGNLGSQKVTINAVSQGMSLITVLYKNSETGTLQTENYVVTVTGVSTTVQTAPTLNLVLNETKAITDYMDIDPSSVRSANTGIVSIVAVSTTQFNVKAVAVGTTNITFTAKPNNGTTSYSYTMPVTVTNASQGSGSSATAGSITFNKTAYTLSKSKAGKAYTFNGQIKLNGESVKVNELLWLSTDTAVVSVNSKTGKFKVLKNSGSARLIAVTKDGKNIGSVTVNAK